MAQKRKLEAYNIYELLNAALSELKKRKSLFVLEYKKNNNNIDLNELLELLIKKYSNLEMFISKCIK